MEIKEIINKELKKLSIETDSVNLGHPKILERGDYSFFVKNKNVNLEVLLFEKINHKYIKKVEALGRFINIHLSEKFFADSLKKILKTGDKFGRGNRLKGKKIIVEYTQPNPFKEFHIGHLVNNSVGEAISRIIEAEGAKVWRVSYHGDVGLHVAKSIWALKKDGIKPSDVAELGKAYAQGDKAYEEDATAKKEIIDLNKKIYEKSDPKVNKLYETGKKLSLDHFKKIYERLGSKFDASFFESDAGVVGKKTVLDFIGEGVFVESEGAVIFSEDYSGLHTRVFLTSEGLPTYEAKDLGLIKLKKDKFDFDLSITVTDIEQAEYFKVVKKAMEVVYRELQGKIEHISHGRLRLPEGRLSSRAGNIVSCEALLDDVEKRVIAKMADRKIERKNEVANDVAVGAIKYSILKQSPGNNIVFDFEKSLSFDGDSGPYLEYSHARANSILEKAKEEGILEKLRESVDINNVVKMLYRFPEVVSRAYDEYAPQYIATYLAQIAASFNNYYAKNKIVDKENKDSGAKVALVHAFKIVMKNGLNILGIQAPEKM